MVNAPSAIVMGWSPPSTSITASRRLTRPSDGVPVSAWSPSESGPRWTIASPIRSSARRSIGRPSPKYMPAIPHTIGHIVQVCGISGSVQARADGIARAVGAQLACQRHRGPDAEGHFDGGRGVVAQNRLSIIDLVTGDPPVTNEDATIGAVLNGEIYNFPQLREALRADGHELSTEGDTELIAHLAEHHGPAEIARRLDG